MPFELTNEGKYLLLRFHGTVTPEEVQTCGKELGELEDSLDVAADRVTDLTGMTALNFNFPAVFQLANKRRVREMPGPVKSVLIARSALTIGYARMFQTLNDNPRIEIRILPSLQEAIGWFEQPPITGA